MSAWEGEAEVSPKGQCFFLLCVCMCGEGVGRNLQWKWRGGGGGVVFVPGEH